MNFRYHEAARDELFAAALFYEKHQAGLGDQFRSAVEEAIQRVLTDPESFPKDQSETRSVSLKRFPFQLMFLVANDFVEIYAVAHHCRRPDYWKHRLPDNEG